MIGRESILWFNVQDEVIVHAPVLVYQDAINAPKANPIEKVECGFGGPLAGFVRAVREPGFDEEASARDSRRGIEIGREQNSIGRVAGSNVSEDQFSSRQARGLRQIEMCIVDPKSSMADAIAQAHPSADAFDIQR